MQDRQQYIQEVERKLGEWDAKIDHVRLKAEREGGPGSQWLEHTLQKRQQVDELLSAVKGGDEQQLEAKKGEIAIATQELEVAMVRAADRFDEAKELGLDPEARKEIKDEPVEGKPQTGYETRGGEVRSGSGTSKVGSIGQTDQSGSTSSGQPQGSSPGRGLETGAQSQSVEHQDATKAEKPKDPKKENPRGEA